MANPNNPEFPEQVPNTLDKFEIYKKFLQPMLVDAYKQVILEIQAAGDPEGMPFTHVALALQGIDSDPDDPDSPDAVNVIALVVAQQDRNEHAYIKQRRFRELLQGDSRYTTIANATVLRVITPEEYAIYQNNPDQLRIRKLVKFDLAQLIQQNP